MSTFRSLLSKSPKLTTLPLSVSWQFLPTISTSFLSTVCCKTLISSVPTNPPSPKKLPFNVTAHGHTWEDPYHWMSNINHPDFISYINQENSYAEAFMADTRNMQRVLFSEMDSRIPAKISSPPEQLGPWLYYQCIPEGKEYPVLCRKQEIDEDGWLGSLFGCMRRGFRRDEILLDWNEIAEKYGYVHVGTCRISPDHNFLAYTLDTTGSENFILQIKDLRDGHMIPGIKVDSVRSLAWAQDSSTLFYTVCDENQRPYRVYCTEVGSGLDTLVFTEDDSRFCVDITCTKDGKFITVNSNSRTSSEVYVINTTNSLDDLRRVHKRVHGVQYFLEHHHGYFFVLTNNPIAPIEKLCHGQFYLGICRVEDINSADWQCIIMPGKGTTIHDMDIFDGHLVLVLDKEGSSAICSIDLPLDFNCQYVREIEELNPWMFPVPSDSCGMVPGSNHSYSTSKYRMVLSSPVMPDLWVEYDMFSRRFSIVDQEEVLGASADGSSKYPMLGVDNKRLLSNKCGRNKNGQDTEGLQNWKEFSLEYACEVHEVVSHDGIRIPLTIVFSKDKWRRKQSHGLLQAYGSYGEVLEKGWCSDRLSLFDRGWVVAFADVRLVHL